MNQKKQGGISLLHTAAERGTSHKVFNKAAEVSATCLLLGDNMSISALCAFLEFYFFLRMVNKCDNIDTENMSHFSYSCKMRYQLNLVLESCEYL